MTSVLVLCEDSSVYAVATALFKVLQTFESDRKRTGFFLVSSLVLRREREGGMAVTISLDSKISACG